MRCARLAKMKSGANGWLYQVTVVMGVLVLQSQCSTYLNGQTEFVSESGDVESVIVSKNGTIIVATSDELLQFRQNSISTNNIVSQVGTLGNISIFNTFSYNGCVYLLRCSYNSCSIYNATNVTQFWATRAWSTDSEGNLLGGEYSAQVIFVPCDGRYCNLFSAISSDRLIDTFSERVITFYDNEDIFYLDHRAAFSRYIKSKPNTNFQFVFSFYSETGFVYFLRNSISPNGQHVAYISQMCYKKSHTYFRSYMESKLQCNGYDVIVAATLVKAATGSLIVASFRGSQPKYPGSIVCRFNLSTVETYFDREQKQCFLGKKGSWPDWVHWNATDKQGQNPNSTCTEKIDRTTIACGHTNNNTRILFDGSLKNDNTKDSILLSNHKEVITSVLITKQNNTFVAYVGTDKGHLEKILFDDAFAKSVSIVYAQVSNEQGSVSGLITSADGSKVLYIQRSKASSKLYMLSTDDCGIHSECYGCLTDLLQCVWIQDPQDGQTPPTGRCIERTKINENTSTSHFYESFCPPQVHAIYPRAGPVNGGTTLQITGLMDNSGYYKRISQNDQVYATVKIGNTTCMISDTSQFPESIECVTPERLEPGAYPVVLEMRNSADNSFTDMFQPKRSFGIAEFKPSFSYLEPVLFEPEDVLSVKMSGNIQITLEGRDLDIGSQRRVLIGGKLCNITSLDRVINNEITCRAPRQNDTGNYTITYEVDNSKIIGPVVRYLGEPVVIDIQPRFSIVSGGLTLTISGDNLEGLGQNCQLYLGDRNRTYTNASLCEIQETSSGKVLLCKTQTIKSLIHPPFPTTASLVNVYGRLQRIDHLNVMILEDPVMERGDKTIALPGNLNQTDIKFKGTGLMNISTDDVAVYVGSSECIVQELLEDGLLCIMFKLNSVTESLKERVTCKLGYRTYDLGTVVFIKNGSHSKANNRPEIVKAGYETVVVAAAVICGLIVVIFVAFGIKKMASKGRRESRDQYNVHFRRDSNILTLDGLSESHTSDVIQNRQNDYQENRFLRAAPQDLTYVKDTEPLLPVLDEDTRTLFEQKNLIIPSEVLLLGEIIGEGHFGCVYKGYLTLQNEKAEKIVACKTLHKNDPRDLDVTMFLKEALLMKDFRHHHVMELIGICLGIDKLPLVVLPYMTKGDVLSFIRDVNNKPTVKDLVLFGVDIANGMHYLAQLKFIHRDLAARNCMIDDDMKVKVADFGLSRDVYEKEYYSSCDKKAKLPVKWMSPESLEFGLFTHKSDVWSFGVVLWELLTRGMNPYPTVDNWDILRYLREDRRMSKPDFCPEEMYKIMQQCWRWNPEERPTFGDLTIKVPELLRKLERASEKRKQLETSY